MLKKNYRYFIYFICFLTALIIFVNSGNDTIWNYGMAHAIRIGEIPYKDFNIISTPLYAFVMSLGLFIKDTYFIYILEQAILCVFFMYLVEKIVGKRSILVLVSFCFPIFNTLFPNYNFLVLLFLTLLVYLEKDNCSDKTIGLVLGLLILSKHTIGICVLLASMISTLTIKRSLKRFFFSLVPIGIFIIYLIITNSLYNFIDLSILGLFDFGGHNSSISIFSISVSISILIYAILALKKDYHNKYMYYLIGSIFFVIPICDLFHVFYLICFFSIIYSTNKEWLEWIKVHYIGYILIALICILNVISNRYYFRHIEIDNNLKYFKANIVTDDVSKYIKNILKKYQSYENSYMISMPSMFFDIEAEHKITYFDIPLHGNFGYNGISKMKNRIAKLHNSYFFIQDNSNGQFANELNDFIRSNYDFIEKVEDFEIYYIK